MQSWTGGEKPQYLLFHFAVQAGSAVSRKSVRAIAVRGLCVMFLMSDQEESSDPYSVVVLGDLRCCWINLGDDFLCSWFTHDQTSFLIKEIMSLAGRFFLYPSSFRKNMYRTKTAATIGIIISFCDFWVGFCTR